MKKILSERRLCELAGLRAEADTEEMPPVGDPEVTHQLTPVEFAQELAKQIDLEQVSEKELLAGWRQWSAAARQAREANKPPPPPESVLPADAVQQSLTATQDINYDPDPTGEEFKKKWSGRKYTESERLFRHFFGKYLDSANQPGIELYEAVIDNEDLLDIIIQLYGWQLPKEFRTKGEFGDLPAVFGARFDSKGAPLFVQNIEHPGTDVMKLAQEFEAESKPIEGNEEEFIERLQGYQHKTGKAQMEPLKQAQAQAMAKENALGDIIDLAALRDPRYDNLPPVQHFTGQEREKYERQLMKVFKDDYEDLYKKYLDAYLS